MFSNKPTNPFQLVNRLLVQTSLVAKVLQFSTSRLLVPSVGLFKLHSINLMYHKVRKIVFKIKLSVNIISLNNFVFDIMVLAIPRLLDCSN